MSYQSGFDHPGVISYTTNNTRAHNLELAVVGYKLKRVGNLILMKVTYMDPHRTPYAFNLFNVRTPPHGIMVNIRSLSRPAIIMNADGIDVYLWGSNTNLSNKLVALGLRSQNQARIVARAIEYAMGYFNRSLYR